MRIEQKKKKKKTFHLLFGSILRLCLVCIWVLKSSSSSKWEAHKALQWSTWLNCVRYTTIAQGEEIRKNEVLCYLVNFTAFWHYFRGTFAFMLVNTQRGMQSQRKADIQSNWEKAFSNGLDGRTAKQHTCDDMLLRWKQYKQNISNQIISCLVIYIQ